MTDQTPTVVLVHGAFAESTSWKGVIELLQAQSIDVVAAANPLRTLTGDAAYVRDVVKHVPGPVVLVGHSYGGMVITQAASENPEVVALVYVCAFAPDHGEDAFQLSNQFPGSTLGEAIDAIPLADGGTDLAIRPDVFHQQFAADVPAPLAAVMAAVQRPVAQAALTEGLPTRRPAWADKPSYFVYGNQDLNIPAELHRFMAKRADARDVEEVAGGSHALGVSDPDAVARTILDAVRQAAR